MSLGPPTVQLRILDAHFARGKGLSSRNDESTADRRFSSFQSTTRAHGYTIRADPPFPPHEKISPSPHPSLFPFSRDSLSRSFSEVVGGGGRWQAGECVAAARRAVARGAADAERSAVASPASGHPRRRQARQAGEVDAGARRGAATGPASGGAGAADVERERGGGPASGCASARHGEAARRPRRRARPEVPLFFSFFSDFVGKSFLHKIFKIYS